ncbi:hypothetical protein D3C76_1760910 [compost metagenome]
MYGTQCGALAVDLLDGIVKSLNRLLGTSSSQDVQIANGGLGFACIGNAGCETQITQRPSCAS